MSSENILIIGGGPGGLETARSVAELGGRVVLIEKRDRLGGTPDAAQYAASTNHFMDAEEIMQKMIAAITGDPSVNIRLSSKVVGLEGGIGNFCLTVENSTGRESLDAGAIIICTGFDHFDPGRQTQIYRYS